MLGAPTTPPESPNFGSFTLLAKLARGDIGDLFLARSRGAGGFEKLVIIKRIHPEFMRDREISELFHSEAQTAARVEHPNVRIIYEIGKNEEHHYIALEYLQGVPLVDVLLSRKRERRLADPRLIASLISQACQGLHAAHKLTHNGRPFVHGDINPRSIFVTDSGTSKLLDFDIVEMRGALAQRHGFVRRTIAYMSPEEVRTNICDRRSDIFSLGVVAWEAITGKRLFKQESRELTMAAIDRGRVPNAKDHRSNISDALNATIMRALSNDPTLRFQSAQDFGSALDRAMLSEGPPLTPVAISTLIKDAFGPALQTQRDFVQTARNSQDGAHKAFDTDSPEDFEKPTVVATRPVELDEWSGDEPATTVGGEELLAAIQAMGEPTDGLSSGVPLERTETDPFKKISENADFSAGHAPIWQDTRNLVLSEVEAESISQADDDEKTGAVVLPKGDVPRAASSQAAGSKNAAGKRLVGSSLAESDGLEVEAETRDQTIPGRRKTPAVADGPRDAASPAPALEAPLVAKPESSTSRTPRSTAAASIYDRRVSAPQKRLDFATGSSPAISSPPPVEPVEVVEVAHTESRSSKLVPLVVSIAAVAAAVFFYLSTTRNSETKPKPTKASAVAKPVVNVEPAKTSGAGAAAGILAAAGEVSSTAASSAPQRDAGSAAVAPRVGSAMSPDAAQAASASNRESSEPRLPKSGKDATAEPQVKTDTKPTSKRAQSTASKTPKTTSTPTTKAVKTKPTSKTAKTKVPSKPAKTTSKGPGFLTVAASPYATVFVDGKKRGITPLVKLKLKPGMHRVKLVSSAGGKSKSMKVRITSGDTMRQNVRF